MFVPRLLLVAAISSLLLLLGYSCLKLIISLRRNIVAARRSGLPYVVVPVFWLSNPWRLCQPFWWRILRRLPERWTQWVDLVLPEIAYDRRYDPFKRVGHDTYMTVSPTRNTVFTCDPCVIAQITARRNDFPKPTEFYAALDIFGPNVVSAEGHSWRQQRKAASLPFSEANNHLVWKETIIQTKNMLADWLTGADSHGSRSIRKVMDDTMKLSLYVISGAGFGRRPAWPAHSLEIDNMDQTQHTENDGSDTDPGHMMSWTFALCSLVGNMILYLVFPPWLLGIIPHQKFRSAHEAYGEWKLYMDEAIATKRSEMIYQEGLTKAVNYHTPLGHGQDRKHFEKDDVLRALIQGQATLKGLRPLSDQEILGNMFVLIVAGHETTGNAIHFSILYLALHMESQKRLQTDLDSIFGDRPIEEWDYDRDLVPLSNGMAGAVLAEQLRLVPPAPSIPKCTFGLPDQIIKVEGRECVIPPDTLIALQAAVAARNPNHWPIAAPTYPGGRPVHPVSNVDNDLEEFRPERWLKRGGGDQFIAPRSDHKPESTSEPGNKYALDATDHWFRPRKGAYLPFSEGPRSCLGRRFAQVEVMAALAVLYRDYSIELDVSKYASDAELDKMTVNERAEVWQKAAEEARTQLLTGMQVVITLQMSKNIPIRVRKRGQERFPVNVDEIWKSHHADQCSPLGDPNWRRWKV